MKVIKVNQESGSGQTVGFWTDSGQAIRFGHHPEAQHESHWGAVQRERADKSAVLEFFIIDCGCGTKTMVEFEYVPSTETKDRVELECPGCDHKETFGRPADLEGVKVRILESWHKSALPPAGINQQDLECKIAELNHVVEQLIREREEILRQLPDPEPRIERVAMTDVRFDHRSDAATMAEIFNVSFRIARHELFDEPSHVMLRHIGDMVKDQVMRGLHGERISRTQYHSGHLRPYRAGVDSVAHSTSRMPTVKARQMVKYTLQEEYEQAMKYMMSTAIKISKQKTKKGTPKTP